MVENKRADALRDAVCCILSSTGTAECIARIPAIAKAALAHDNELLYAEDPAHDNEILYTADAPRKARKRR